MHVASQLPYRLTAAIQAVCILMQGAIDKLEVETIPDFSRGLIKGLPHPSCFWCWPPRFRRTAPYTVHDTPHAVWRRTRSSSDEGDECQGSWSDLADAALNLLADTTLAEAVTCPQQEQQLQEQQQQQHWQWHAGDCPVNSPRQLPSHSAARNWDAFAQQCLVSRVRAVTAAELLGQQVAAASSSDDHPSQPQVNLPGAPIVTA